MIMIAGTIYVVFFADDFLGPFQGFLITLGVPVAAWCGVMLADLAAAPPRLRRGRPVRPGRPVRRRAAGCRCYRARRRHRHRLGPGHQHLRAAGWPGRATCSGPLGLGGRNGAWAFANLGVLVALVLGFPAPGSPAAACAQQAGPVAAGG